MKIISTKPDSFTEPTGKELATAQSLEAQQAASLKIPFIKSPDSVAGALIGPKSLVYVEIAVPGSSRYPFVTKGDYVYVEKISFDTAELQGVNTFPPQIKADTIQTPISLFEGNREISFPVAYSNLELINTGGYDVTIGLWIGFGHARRDRFTKFSRTVGTIGLASNTPFAANDVLGLAHFVYGLDTQWGTIRKAHYFCENPITTQNFSLWLFAKSPIVTENTPFSFVPSGVSTVDFLGKIDFSAFSAGGAGNYSVGVRNDLNIPIFAKLKDANGYPNLTFYAVAVTNAAYTKGAGETSHTIDLQFELP